jgi:predicted phosphodiesterase
MRIFALSDVHVDFEANAMWVADLSKSDYRNDVLILAGDISDSPEQFEWGLGALAERFKKVVFVPGNHDLWVRGNPAKDSFEKFAEISEIAKACGVSMDPYHDGALTIVPLLGWYDYSFGQPGDKLKSIWMDYQACRWPPGYDVKDVSAHFCAHNEPHLSLRNAHTITFSHFLPRIDLMPRFIPFAKRLIYPVLGTIELERQLRSLKPMIHVYGHSHVNRRVEIDGICYINNAFGYPSETRIAAKRLVCILDGAVLAETSSA